MPATDYGWHKQGRVEGCVGGDISISLDPNCTGAVNTFFLKKKKEKQPGGLISLRMAAASLENTEYDSKGSWLSLHVRTLDDIKRLRLLFLSFWQEFANFTHLKKLT